MALANIKVIATEQEAVKFATDRRPTDRVSYNLEKPRGMGYDHIRVRALLQTSPGYHEYQRLNCVMHPAVTDGTLRRANITLARHNPDALQIMKDFVDRANARICSDDRYRQFHDTYVQPLGDLIRNKKQLSLPQPDGNGVVMVQYWVGPTRDQWTHDRIEEALSNYIAHYYPPLRFERTGKGDYTFHESHGAVDPNNPHNFPHVHVWHATEVYKTTLRLA